MAYRFASQLLTGAYHFGVGGLGVRGDEVPSTGTHGAGYLYNDITLPGEAADEFYGYITSPPVGLTTFFAYEDSSFSAAGPDGVYSFTYTGYKNGASYGSATATFTIGATVLAVSDATHAHTADALTLSTQAVLALADATHAHTADAVVLTTSSTLAVQDATHGHAADNLTLSGTGTAALVIADATHGHTADAATLTTTSALVLADAAHAHTADNLTLTIGGASLTAADAVHAHTADAIAFTLDSWLVVADARHVHRADNIVLTLPSTGAMYGGPARTGRGYARSTLRGQAREPIRGYRPS